MNRTFTKIDLNKYFIERTTGDIYLCTSYMHEPTVSLTKVEALRADSQTRSDETVCFGASSLLAQGFEPLLLEGDEGIHAKNEALRITRGDEASQQKGTA